MSVDPKIEALAKFLEVEVSEVEDADCGVYGCGRSEYLVLTDEEADAWAADEISNSLWAFRAEFLAAHSDADAEVFETMQATNKCESLSPVFRRLIRDWEHFVDDAIKADGRGHFLSPYDGEENEAGEFFVYRLS